MNDAQCFSMTDFALFREAAEVEAQEVVAPTLVEMATSIEVVDLPETLPEPQYAARVTVDTGNFLSINHQLELVPQTAVDAINADAFFEASYDALLRQMIEQIVDLDGPIRDTVLARRIARSHGWQRTGARIQERVSSIAQSCLQLTEEDVGVFFWANGRGPESPILRRGDGDGGRNVDEICMVELTSLARQFVAEGMAGDVAVVALAKRLGMHHVRSASRTRLEKALEQAQG